MEKLIGLLLFGYTLFCNCGTESAGYGFEKNKREYKVEAYARMPKALRESSGLIAAPGGTFWTMPDGGNPSHLYHINAGGEVLDTLQLPLPNTDWESLTKDPDGNIYIGDFGNNFHNRKNLRIFIIREDKLKIDTIHFTYPEQEEFPPSDRKDRNYDSEAFFWHNGRLHLFSKSYGDKIVRHYSLPDSAGSYELIYEEEKKLKGLVTGAALSPGGQQLALLSYGRIYLFNVNSDDGLLKSPYKCVSLVGRAQTEAITYLNNEDLLLTNEQGKLIYVYKK